MSSLENAILYSTKKNVNHFWVFGFPVCVNLLLACLQTRFGWKDRTKRSVMYPCAYAGAKTYALLSSFSDEQLMLSSVGRKATSRQRRRLAAFVTDGCGK